MQQILRFCRGLQEKHFAAGEVVLPEGRCDDFLYILIEGECEVLKDDVLIITISEPGAIFGEISALLNIPPFATVKAITPCRAYVVEKANDYIKSNREIAYYLSKLLAQRLNWVVNYLVDINTQFADHRDHLGMVDEVLEALIHQQNEECLPGCVLDPNTTM